MNVIGYVRAGSVRPAGGGEGAAEQMRRIREWSDGIGAATLTLISDAGASGLDTADRPGLQAALSAAGAGSVLVITSSARLARSVEDLRAIVVRLAAQGSGLVSLSEPIDTTREAGRDAALRLLSALEYVHRTRARAEGGHDQCTSSDM